MFPLLIYFFIIKNLDIVWYKESKSFMENNRPIIGILLGDPSGIGPELISKLLHQQEVKEVNILIIGEKNILHEADRLTGFNSDLEYVSSHEQARLDFVGQIA